MEEKIKTLLLAAKAVTKCSMLTYGTYEHPGVGGNIIGPMVVCAPQEMQELIEAIEDIGE